MLDDLTLAKQPIGFLQPFPQHAVHLILSYVCYIKDEADARLVVANNLRVLDAAQKLEDEKELEALKQELKPELQQKLTPERIEEIALEHQGISTWPFTSFGVDDDQLFPEEHYAFIHAEVAANLNAMAEARGRPRPQKLAGAELDGENDLGRAGEDAGIEDEDGVANIEVDDKEALPLRSGGVEYRAHHPLHTDEVFDAVHRVVDASKVDGRTGYICLLYTSDAADE